jgi:hypothetical protein
LKIIQTAQDNTQRLAYQGDGNPVRSILDKMYAPLLASNKEAQALASSMFSDEHKPFSLNRPPQFNAEAKAASIRAMLIPERLRA